MDASETHVREYLEYLALGDVIYQPDGNIPPDFLVDGRIAVEVRRLNENELTESGGFRGLESDRISTGRKFDALLRSLGPAKSGTSWFVGCKLKRPVPRWKEIEADLRQALEHVRDNEDCQRLGVLKIAEGFEYTLFTTPVVLIQRASCLPVVTTKMSVVLCLATRNGTCVSASKTRCGELPAFGTNILNGGWCSWITSEQVLTIAIKSYSASTLTSSMIWTA